MGEDSAGEIEELDEAEGELHIFEGAGPILGGEEVIAFGVVEAFADIFEGVGVGPADANGFFGEGEGLLALSVNEIVGLNPAGLVGEEIFREEAGGVDVDGWEDGGHGRG